MIKERKASRIHLTTFVRLICRECSEILTVMDQEIPDLEMGVSVVEKLWVFRLAPQKVKIANRKVTIYSRIKTLWLRKCHASFYVKTRTPKVIQSAV